MTQLEIEKLIVSRLEEIDEPSSSSTAVQPSTREVQDDVLLICGCHFHWECLLDQSPTIKVSNACPACGKSILTGSQVLTIYVNEGGINENFDIRPAVLEEAYLIESM
jgi:hypothetical protein